MSGPLELQAYRRAGVVSRDDIAAAELLVGMARRDGAAEPPLLAWVGMCLALRTVRDGHTCVDLGRIEEWAGDLDAGASEWPSAAAWRVALEAAPALIGAPGDRRPFVLDGRRLYLARSLAEEESIATAVRQRAARGALGILLGGPGTGKTTKVARDLVARLDAVAPGDAAPRIALAAPTGKAAARMGEAVRTACQRAAAPPELIERILAEPARTVHALLGFHPGRAERFTYRAGHCLPHDIVIVDEASMLSSTLMHHLLAAVRPDAELRLVGDPDQLASVDAGTVLGDIAVFGGAHHAGSALHGRIETLEKVHRAESRAILDLARAIRGGEADTALGILRAGGGTVVWVDPDAPGGLDRLEREVGAHAARLGAAARGGDPRTILETRAALQVLCGHREGPMGVAGWNARIERGLGIGPADVWYPGRPVIVTRNSRALGLANGDVGVIVPLEMGGGLGAESAGETRMQALFGLPEQAVRLPVSRLEDIATVHALTIHKSQGSEYDHAVVVLPERPSRIVTRELLYTGVTRARRQVTVVGSEDVIRAAIDRPIRRATGLTERLDDGA